MKTKIIIAVALVVVIITVAFAQNNKSSVAELPDEVKQWELMAENGDTASLHKLLRFYDENAMEFIEVAEIIDSDGNEVSQAEVEAINEENRHQAEESAKYAERLEYWLAKGLAMDGPVATYIKGMRLYYTDETQALEYLAKSADSGNSQAALYCGSAYFNQGQIDKAIKYQAIAYNAGVPSAGWHLAMCLARFGDESDIEDAIEYMRHSAMLDYPEAVLEMKRIEPTNKLWQQKADSLEIDVADFPIIPK